MGNRRRAGQKVPMTPATAAALLRGGMDAKKEDTGDDAARGWRLPRPDRDERDPSGKLERLLLQTLEVEDEPNASEAYKQAHPAFAQLYERLLERGLDATLHSRELQPQVEAFAWGKKQ